MHKFRDTWRLVRPTAYMILVLAVLTFPYWVGGLLPSELDRRFRLVQIGMTFEEVETTLGVPPGDYGPAGASTGRASADRTRAASRGEARPASSRFDSVQSRTAAPTTSFSGGAQRRWTPWHRARLNLQPRGIVWEKAPLVKI